MAENIRRDNEEMIREEELNRGTQQQGGGNRPDQPTQQQGGSVGDIQGQRRDIEEEVDEGQGDVRGGQQKKSA